MTTQNNDEEVKETSEDEVDDEAEVTDEESEPEAKIDDEEATEEEKETPAESSDDDQPAEEKESDSKESDDSTKGDESVAAEPEKSPPTGGPKPVPGETPRESALRLEVQRVKKALRTERGTKMFKDADVPMQSEAELSDEDKKVLEQFDPEQVANMQKLFAIQAKKMGFVKKDDFTKNTYQEKSQEILDEFLEAHPELDKDNDKGDVLWKQFQENVKLYRSPSNPKDYKKIFEKAHKDIFGVQTDDTDLRKIAAKQEKTKVASHGAAASKPSSKPAAKAPVVDAELKDLVKAGALKGFSAEELKEMGLD